ncbi:MAG: NUDIX hydrolase [Candidatus Marinimicrobia bacterium]|nr:NUDIX hydrolase [Candidatus Neomarinimicrobiota bacterium]MCF7829206.1 NUDIX hydrolase [Candidatus Neomarinimicrobiota bacterium]MCF7881141.1 NUDIX hydrolase [Candidatus Neomarinimicrobiota bacterium]
MADLTETQLSSEKVFSGVLLHVYKDEVELPDGGKSIREYIKHPGASVMIPVLNNGDLVMEKQFRYPVGEEMWELPAGKIDEGEDSGESAYRELLEETGYEAGNLIRLGKLHPGIGYSNEIIHIYVAEDLTFHEEQQDHDEFIETFTLSLNEALDAVRSGKITDAKSMVGIFWAEKYLNGEWKPEG